MVFGYSGQVPVYLSRHECSFIIPSPSSLPQSSKPSGAVAERCACGLAKSGVVPSDRASERPRPHDGDGREEGRRGSWDVLGATREHHGCGGSSVEGLRLRGLIRDVLVINR